MRASTPTDAAKLVVPDVSEELRLVGAARQRLRHVLGGWLAREQAGLDALRSRPVLGDPRGLLDERAAEVHELRERGRRTLSHRLDRAADDIAHHRARARALSPLATLERGYAVVQRTDGAASSLVTSVADVSTGVALSIRVVDGRIAATTTDVEAEPIEESHG